MTAPSPARRSARTPGTQQGLVLVLVSSLSVMIGVLPVPVLPRLLDVFRSVPNAIFWVPALLSGPAFATVLLAPVAGALGDRYGRRRLLLAGAWAFAAIGIMPAFLNDFWIIFVSRILLGVVATLTLVLSTTMIGDYFEGAARDRWLALQMVAATCSALVLIPLGGVLGAQVGWHGVFLGYALAVPICIAISRLTWEPARTAPAAETETHAALPWRWLAGVLVVTIFASILFYAVQFQIGLALRAVGVMDPARIGLLSTIAVIGVPTGAFLFWKLAALPAPLLLGGEFLVAGICLVAMPGAMSPASLVALAFLSLAATGLMLPTLITLVSRRLDPAVRARGIGFWQGAFALGQVLSPAATALVLIQPHTDILDAFRALGCIATVAGGAGLAMAYTIRARSPAVV